MPKFYPKTTAFFQTIINIHCPGLRAKENEGDPADPAHILWMLQQIDSLGSIGKRGRWIGHINGVLVAKKWISNRISIKTVNMDIENGFE